MQSMLTLLLVDAGSEDRGLLKSLLSRDGSTTYSFLEADHVDEALKVARLGRPDCALLAYPWTDESSRAAHAPAALRDVCGAVLVLSTLEWEQKALEVARYGADGCLLKGQLTTANLSFAVDHAVRQARLIQRLETQRGDLQRTIDVHQDDQLHLARQQHMHSRELLRLNRDLQEEVGRSRRAGAEALELRQALAQAKQRKVLVQKTYRELVARLRKDVRMPLQAVLGEFDLSLQEAGLDPVYIDRVLRPGQAVLDHLDACLMPPVAERGKAAPPDEAAPPDQQAPSDTPAPTDTAPSDSPAPTDAADVDRAQPTAEGDGTLAPRPRVVLRLDLGTEDTDPPNPPA